MEEEPLAAPLRPLLAGRDVVLAGAPLAAMAGLGALVRQLGAGRVFFLAAGTGTGPLPAQEDGERYVLEVRAADVIAEIRSSQALLGALPAGALDALDRWDPRRRALVIAGPFNELATVAGRRAWAPRRPAWRRLEDKTVVDALWDDLGLRRAPAAVVAAEPAALRAAGAALDRGAGTVWAGDAREGFNGGAVYCRWVRTDADGREAAGFLGAHCDLARVMPFLEGVPCSIHGMVLPDGVAAFRPVEMVTLRRPGASRLLYAGAATFWDPPAADRDAMRALARRVGDGLRERVGYRGAFTVDGVLTAGGFLPTELNPRFGAALAMMTRGRPLQLLNMAVVEGEPAGLRAAELEDVVVGPADRRRAGGAWTVTATPAAATRELPVVFDGGACRPAAAHEAADATLAFGPSNVGGFLRLTLDPARAPVGPPAAPLAVAAFALADERFGAALGPLEAARPVR
jgi:hypothetical protein